MPDMVAGLLCVQRALGRPRGFPGTDVFLGVSSLLTKAVCDFPGCCATGVKEDLGLNYLAGPNNFRDGGGFLLSGERVKTSLRNTE